MIPQCRVAVYCRLSRVVRIFGWPGRMGLVRNWRRRIPGSSCSQRLVPVPPLLGDGGLGGHHAQPSEPIRLQAGWSATPGTVLTLVDQSVGDIIRLFASTISSHSFTNLIIHVTP
jgi:hypothetical protein